MCFLPAISTTMKNQILITIFIAIFISSCGGSSSNSEATIIEGTIRRENNEPVEAVLVCALGSCGTTSAEGYYILEVPLITANKGILFEFYVEEVSSELVVEIETTENSSSYILDFHYLADGSFSHPEGTQQQEATPTPPPSNNNNSSENNTNSDEFPCPLSEEEESRYYHLSAIDSTQYEGEGSWDGIWIGNASTIIDGKLVSEEVVPLTILLPAPIIVAMDYFPNNQIAMQVDINGIFNPQKLFYGLTDPWVEVDGYDAISNISSERTFDVCEIVYRPYSRRDVIVLHEDWFSPAELIDYLPAATVDAIVPQQRGQTQKDIIDNFVAENSYVSCVSSYEFLLFDSDYNQVNDTLHYPSPTNQTNFKFKHHIYCIDIDVSRQLHKIVPNGDVITRAILYNSFETTISRESQ